MYPEDCPQSYVGPWWIEDTGATVTRGRLLWTVATYPEQKPLRLVPADRGDDPRQHSRATYRLEAFRVGDPPPPVGPLPVAALPIRDGETYLVQRGKRRPAIVLSTGGTEIPSGIAQGRNRWQAANALLVAPYYGADPGGTRGGWPAAFVERIRHAEYPQYVWDRLPLPGSGQSILWLSHLFAIGADPAGYRLEGWRLSAEGLALLDEWLQWLLTGSLDASTSLGMLRQSWLDQ